MDVFDRGLRRAATWVVGAGVACSPPDVTVHVDALSEVPLADAGAPLRAHVGEPVHLDAGASVGTAFRWTTSDGQTVDGAAGDLVFAAPGHYSAVLEAYALGGAVHTDSVSITVTWPRMDPAPVAAAALASDPAGEHLYVALADFDAIAEIDVGSRTVVGWTPVCAAPRSVAVGHGAVWVACAGDDAVVRLVDGVATRTELGRGQRPFGVVARADDVLVTLQGTGGLARLDPSGALLAVTPVLPDVRGLAATSDAVLVSRYRSPDAGGEALLLDADLAEIAAVTLPVDPGPDSDTNSRGLPNLLARPVVRPDGRVVAVGGSKANIERGLYRDGLPLTFETTCRADLRVVALDPAEGTVGVQLDAAVFDDRDQVISAAYSPDGDWLFALHPGMETLDILDAVTLERAGAAPDVGAGAEGVWIAPDGGTAWVYGAASRTLRVFDLATIAAPAQVADLDLVPTTGEVLAEDVLTGKVLFGRSVDPRMSAAGYLSCASCHPEGDHDGRTWDFTDRGEGVRNTISLLGRAGRAPIHWSANFDEVQDFENDIRGPMQGQGFLTDEDFEATSDPLAASKAGRSAELDALAAYVASLDQGLRSPYPPDPRGEALFHDPALGCTTCHPEPALTDSAWLAPGEPLLHDVGTLTAASGMRRGEPLVGLDTPSLGSLHATAPYLHDGSAATVRAAIVAAGDDAHGVTSDLSDADLDALANYLLSLE